MELEGLRMREMVGDENWGCKKVGFLNLEYSQKVTNNKLYDKFSIVSVVKLYVL